MREDGITEQQTPPVLLNVLQKQGVQDEEKGIMTLQHATKPTRNNNIAAFSPTWLPLKTIYHVCEKCHEYSKHNTRMDGVRTYYTCTTEGCGNTWEREGSIA